MKKGILNIVLALSLVVAGMSGTKLGVKAAEAEGPSYNWEVTYTGKAFTSTYDENAAVLKNAMPGDIIIYSVDYINGSEYESADFYMSADVVKSLEDGAKAQGGAYSFRIIKNKDTASEEKLFDSETVGGDATESVGLNQVSGKDGAYFALGSVKKGDRGNVTVEITLDGDSQTNNYMAAKANLNIKFGAEDSSSAKYSKTVKETKTTTSTVNQYVPVSEKKSIVKQVIKTLDNGTEVVSIDESQVPLANPQTGDSIIPFAVCLFMFLLGMSLIGFYIKLMMDRKKEVA